MKKFFVVLPFSFLFSFLFNLLAGAMSLEALATEQTEQTGQKIEETQPQATTGVKSKPVVTEQKIGIRAD